MEKPKYTPKVITITDPEDGKDYEFLELHKMQREEGQFVALVPLDEELGALEDSFLLLRLTEVNGETSLSPIEDDELREKIGVQIQEDLFEKYDLSEFFP